MPSDDLQSLPGVGPATADKLAENGYDSYKSIAVADPGELKDEADIGTSTASDTIEAAREAADVGGFENASSVLERRKKIGKISTQVPALDEVFGGGVETQSITEFYGEFGSGKSQFTHQLCVNVQLPEEHGGVGGRGIFIDTEDSFRPERIRQMIDGLDDEILQACLDRDGIDGTPEDDSAMEELHEAFLDRIHVAKAFNSSHQIMLIEKAQELVNEYEDTEYPVRLMCVDSIMAHLRAEYVGRGTLAKRQQKLNKHIADCKQIADMGNCAVIFANQVSANPDSFFGDPEGPVGGNILGHASTFRLQIKKSKAPKRIVKMKDAPNLPDSEAIVRIVEDGITPE